MDKQRSNEEWRQDLAAGGESQAAALQELSQALLRAARFTFERQLGAQFSQLEIEQLAEECAQEALLSILKHLPEFRGESKFLTWAYKFAVNISLTTARREQWKGLSLDDLEGFPASFQGAVETDHVSAGPELSAERNELWAILRNTIQEELTEKQKQVLKWMAFDEVPMDVVVERLGTNRNAIYKLLHDARARLKQSLLRRGIQIDETLDLFKADR